ncbi:MAG: type II toxin-antitoxin system HigB family toxin [Sphingobacteriales bacterium]|nr:type II toxin-antitoxin system HigB family toxin [Sphingobacteriales bacterium]
MRIVHREKIYRFAEKHTNARKSLAIWQDVTEKAGWKNKMEVLKDFPRAKMLKNNRARFEIVHNLYRLIACIRYEEQIAEIRFIGTHAEYDRINPETI